MNKLRMDLLDGKGELGEPRDAARKDHGGVRTPGGGVRTSGGGVRTPGGGVRTPGGGDQDTWRRRSGHLELCVYSVCRPTLQSLDLRTSTNA